MPMLSSKWYPKAPSVRDHRLPKGFDPKRYKWGWNAKLMMFVPVLRSGHTNRKPKQVIPPKRFHRMMRYGN